VLIAVYMTVMVTILPVIMSMFLIPVGKAVLEQILHLRLPCSMIETLVTHDLHPLAIFVVSEEAVIQRSLKGLAVEALSYEDELLAAVAPLTTIRDIKLNELVHFLVACEIVLWGQGAKPRPAAPHGDHGPGLRPLSGTVRAGSKEELSFGPEKTSEQRASSLVGEDDVVGRHIEGFGVSLHGDTRLRVIFFLVTTLGHLFVFVAFAFASIVAVIFIVVRNLELHNELVIQ
jgi:hypothetical protein